MDRIYLDYNATTPVHPEVVNAMVPYLETFYGNPSSVHIIGQKSRTAIEDARYKVATLLNVQKPDELVFTSGGTEANNFAIKGLVAQWISSHPGLNPHLITSVIEHHAILNVYEYLSRQYGVEVTYLKVDQYGIINPADITAAIKDNTVLVSIMHANNEIGTIEPIEEIGNLITEINVTRRKNKGGPVYFHTDAVQTVGKIPVDVQKFQVDLLSLSSHKFYGPKGVGALYIRSGTPIHPLLHGGHHENNRRAGTENVPGIVGLGKAAELAGSEMNKEYVNVKSLRDYLEKSIIINIPYIRINGHPEKRLPNTVNVSFNFIEGESLLLSLDIEGIGIAASTGSACTSGTLEPSHVLTAIDVPADVAQGSLRFSLGRNNTKEEIEYVVSVLPREISRLRAMSPLWDEEKQKPKT